MDTPFPFHGGFLLSSLMTEHVDTHTSSHHGSRGGGDLLHCTLLVMEISGVGAHTHPFSCVLNADKFVGERAATFCAPIYAGAIYKGEFIGGSKSETTLSMKYRGFHEIQVNLLLVVLECVASEAMRCDNIVGKCCSNSPLPFPKHGGARYLRMSTPTSTTGRLTPKGVRYGRLVSYEGCVMAAPMVRVSTLAFRTYCAAQGADVVFSEELVANRVARCVVQRRAWDPLQYGGVGTGRAAIPVGEEGAIHCPFTTGAARELVELASYEVRKGGLAKRSVIFTTFARRHPAPGVNGEGLTATAEATGGARGWAPSLEGAPVVFQLGAADPGHAAKAAALVAPYVDGIDVNMGCPKKFSVDNGMGAALMAREGGGVAVSILSAIRASVGPDMPLSFKTRLHESEDASVAFLVKCARAGAVHSITLHARGVDQRSETTPRYEVAKRVRERLRSELPNVVVIFNGSLGAEGKRAALLAAQSLGFDGALIARHAMWNPTCFQPTLPTLRHHPLPSAATPSRVFSDANEAAPKGATIAENVVYSVGGGGGGGESTTAVMPTHCQTATATTTAPVSPYAYRTAVFRDFLRHSVVYRVPFMSLKYHFLRSFQEWQHDRRGEEDDGFRFGALANELNTCKSYPAMAAALGFSVSSVVASSGSRAAVATASSATCQPAARALVPAAGGGVSSHRRSEGFAASSLCAAEVHDDGADGPVAGGGSPAAAAGDDTGGGSNHRCRSLPLPSPLVSFEAALRLLDDEQAREADALVPLPVDAEKLLPATGASAGTGKRGREATA